MVREKNFVVGVVLFSLKKWWDSVTSKNVRLCFIPNTKISQEIANGKKKIITHIPVSHVFSYSSKHDREKIQPFLFLSHPDKRSSLDLFFHGWYVTFFCFSNALCISHRLWWLVCDSLGIIQFMFGTDFWNLLEICFCFCMGIRITYQLYSTISVQMWSSMELLLTLDCGILLVSCCCLHYFRICCHVAVY